MSSARGLELVQQLRVAERDLVGVLDDRGRVAPADPLDDLREELFLAIVAGLSDATTGGMILGGRETTEAGPDRGVVFQSPCLLPWMTALSNVQLGVDQVYPRKKRSERREI